MDGTERKTNPADNWLSLPCFCAWMAIFTLLSSACWLFYQTKRLAVFHILVLWNGLSRSLPLIALLFLSLPTSSLSLCRSVSVLDWVKYHLSGEYCLDWHEIRTDQLDSYMLFVTAAGPGSKTVMYDWYMKESNAWTGGKNNTESGTAEWQNYYRHHTQIIKYISGKQIMHKAIHVPDSTLHEKVHRSFSHCTGSGQGRTGIIIQAENLTSVQANLHTDSFDNRPYILRFVEI